MNTFQVGQRVVCIANGDYPGARKRGYAVPFRGQVYTIREVRPDPNNGMIGVLLVEVVNPPNLRVLGPDAPLWEMAWDADEFRPVKETDISVFERMLKRQPEKVH